MSETATDPARETTATAVNREHPWPGLMPFGEEAQAFFHGRGTETAELLRLVKRDTLTVLFGQSGLGKSSLLNAGLFPRLRAEDFFPVSVRLDVSTGARPLAEQLLEALAAACARHDVEGPAPHSGGTLWEYFHRRMADFWSDRNRLLTPVLVLDQFEEIFTLGHHVEEMEQRYRAFIEELGDLIEDRMPARLARSLDEDPGLADTLDFSRKTYKVIVAFREDYLAEFEELRWLVPSIMHNRLRITRMTGAQAKEAILLSGGHLVAEPVSEQIIRFVAARRTGGRIDDDPSRLEVEPALLSVVCRELNNHRIRRQLQQITADILQAGAQQQIIRDFYESSLSGIDPHVREFIEDQLLTEAGFRDSYAYDDALDLPGVTREAIDRLIGRRLLRLEERSGVLRVELTHDLLTQVARESRDLRQRREAERRARELEAARRRRFRRVAAIGTIATIVALSVAVVFGVLLDRSVKQQQRLIETQSYALLAQANGQLDLNIAGEPMAILAKSLDLNPRNTSAVGRAVTYLSQRRFPKLLAWMQLRMDPDDRHLLVEWQDANNLRFRSLKLNGSIPLPPDARIREVQLPAGRGTPKPAAAKHRIVRGEPMPAAWADVESPMASSADRRVVAWIEDTQRVRVGWRAAGREHGIDIPAGARAPLVLSPDGRRLMFRSGDGRVIVLGLPTHSAPIVLRSFGAADGSLRTGSDGQGVLALDKDKLSLYDLSSDRLITLTHPLPVNSLELSPDGTLIATACQDKFARIWSVATGTLAVQPLRHDGAVLSLAISNDGARLVTGALDGTARIWSVKTGELLAEPVAMGTAVAEAHISPEGDKLMTYGLNGQIGVWQIRGLESPYASLDMPSPIAAMNASPATSLVALATTDHEVSVWQVVDSGADGVRATRRWAERMPESIGGLLFNADGSVLAVSTSGNGVHLLRADTGVAIGTPLRHHGRVLAMRFSADGALLATGSADGAARTWRVATAQLIGFPLLHGRDAVDRVAFSGDARFLLTASASAEGGHSLRVWQLDDGTVTARITTGEHVALAEFTSDWEIVAVSDEAVTKWSLRPRRRQSEWPAKYTASDVALEYDVSERNRLQFGGVLWSAGISPDGTRIVVGGLDGAARIVDLGTMRPTGESMKSIGVVRSADYSGDGRWIVTQSADRVVRVWDGVSGYPITDNVRSDAELAGAALTGAGAFLVSAGVDGALELRKLGLDFPSPAPPWLAKLVEVAGGGAFDEAGTMVWRSDRSEHLRAFRDSIARGNDPWWEHWASTAVSRLVAMTDTTPKEVKR